MIQSRITHHYRPSIRLVIRVDMSTDDAVPDDDWETRRRRNMERNLQYLQQLFSDSAGSALIPLSMQKVSTESEDAVAPKDLPPLKNASITDVRSECKTTFRHRDREIDLISDFINEVTLNDMSCTYTMSLIRMPALFDGLSMHGARPIWFWQVRHN